MNAAPAPARRRLLLVLILLGFAGAGIAATAWYLRVGQWHETTENAFLGGNLVTVSAELAGTVVRIGADDNDRIEAGAELAQLAEGDTLQLLDARKQELALAVQEVHARRAQAGRAQAELQLREITHRLAQQEFQRRQSLSQRKVLAQEELDAARTRAEETAGELETARHALAESQVRAGNGAVEAHPLVTAAASAVRAAWRDWRRTRVLAPVEGHIARRRVQLGQRITPGQPLFSIAQGDAAWVEANFKEDQLRNLRTGQPVRIVSDLYGEEWVLEGRVSGIGSGTGAVFSVLPAQNATGNWIKIVQRVPVRIALEHGPDDAHPLPIGASLRVSVDTHDRSGSRLPPASSPASLASSAVYDELDRGADEAIAAVIAAAAPNAGALTGAP